MPLVIPTWLAEALREQDGFDVTGHPDYIVTMDPPPRWPLGKPWPPQVTVTAPCWKCAAGTAAR